MDDAIKSLKRQLEIHRRSLRILEERAAIYGEPSNVPLKLLYDIDSLKEKIAELERGLKDPGLITESVREEARGPNRGCRIWWKPLMIWWDPLSVEVKVAYIGLISAVTVAIMGLIGVLGTPIITEFAKSLFAPTPTSVAVASTPTPTLTATGTPASTPIPSPTLSPTDTSSPTCTPTPMPSEEVVIEIDGVVEDDRCQEVDCGSSPRIEVKVLDSTGVPLQPDILSYNWRFDPPDPHNPDKLDSKNYAIIYSVPCDRDNQTITIVLTGGETLYVRSVRFIIRKQP